MAAPSSASEVAGQEGSSATAGPGGDARDPAASSRSAALPWRRMSSFVSLPLISLSGQVVLIPVIASVSGATGWAAVALGQALGVGAATVMQFGWGFTGPTLLVPMSRQDRGRLLWVSTLSRLVVAAVLLPVTAALATVLAPDGRGLLAALTAMAFATFGLSALWFFVGTGRPSLAARYETVPRLVALLASAAVVVVTGEAIWYPVVFLAGQVLSIGWLTVRLGAISFSRQTWAAALRALGRQRYAAASDVLIAVWQAVPTSILAATAPGALAVFAAGDRIQKLGQSGIQPLFNAFQGWVSEAAPPQTPQRMRLAVGATSVCGALAGLLVAVGLPVLDDVLFAGEIAVDPAVSIAFGVALALFSVTSSISFTVLAPSGRTRQILRSTVVGGVTSIVGVSIAAHLVGAPGGAAAVAVAVAQAAALAVQLPAARRLMGGRAPTAATQGPIPEYHPLA
jgi:O-antigen/teichoic acid export membrane protein